MKKIIKEQKDTKTFLTNVYNAGCVAVPLYKPIQDSKSGNWSKSNEIGYLLTSINKGGKTVDCIFGFKEDGDVVLYFADKTKQLLDATTGKSKAEGQWTCKAVEEVGVRYPELNTDQMTNKQVAEIEYLLSFPEDKNEKIYFKSNPEGETKRNSTYEKIDVTTIKDVSDFDNALFSPNTYFVYKKKTLTPDQIKQQQQQQSETATQTKKAELEKLLKPYGYTLEVPQPNTPEYESKTKLLNLPQYGPRFVEWYGSNPDIYGYSGSEVMKLKVNALDKSTCRQKIKELYGYLQYQNSQGAQTILKKEPELLQLKNDVAYCKNNKSFSGGILGVNDELEELYKFMSTRNPFGMADFKQQTESNKSMKKTIKESLVEFQTNKKRILKEERIISSRFKFIIENYNSKRKTEFFENVIREFFYLNSQGFNSQILNEQEFKFFDALKSLFGHKFDSIMGQLKEYFAMWIVNTLGLPKQSIWASMISTGFGNLPLFDIKSIMNCEGLTRYLTKTITEGMVKHLQTKANLNSVFFDYLRNALMESLTKDSEFGKKVEGFLSTLVCPALSSLQGKFGKMEDKLKDAVLSSN